MNKLSSHSRLFFLAALLALSLPTAQAATLATYMFTDYGTNLNTSTPADTGSVFANVTAGSMVDNVDGSGTNAAFSSSSDAYFARSSVTAAAFTGTSYVSFTIAPSLGYELSLSDITFQLAATSDATGTYTINEILRSSIGSYSTDLHTTSITVPINTNTGTVTYTNYAVSLADSTFQNLTTQTEFRFYFWDDSTASNDIIRFNDMTITGTVTAIPEPSSWTLVAFGAGTILCFCRGVFGRSVLK